MNFSAKEVLEIVTLGDLQSQTPNSCACKFIPLTRKWGIKLYSAKFKRDQAYKNQLKCYDVGYAPKVGNCVDLPIGKFKYGYITEIVKVLFDPKHRQDDAYDWEDKNEKKINHIVNEIEKLCGFEFSDCHAFNWGIKNKKLMPIDFGESDYQCYNGYEDEDYSFEDIEKEMLAACE
jgi:hypothetical protein